MGFRICVYPSCTSVASVVKRRYDVVVVGAGAFGAWTAYHLSQRRKRVLLLDAYGPAHSRASSGGETRIIRMGYGPDELYTRMAARSMKHWRALSRRTRQSLFVRTGMLWLARDHDQYPRETLNTLRALRLPCEKLSLRELRKRFPQFFLSETDWGLLEPEAGVLMARRAVQSLVAEIVKQGVRYANEKVAAPAAGSRLRSALTATGREIVAENFVFACGAWLPQIFPELVGPKMFPSRQEVFFFAVPPGNSRYAPPQMPAWYSYAENVYGIPDIGHRGLKIALDRHGPAFDPEKDDRITTAAALAEIRTQLGKFFPELRDAAVAETRVCVYENTSNGDFLIDRHPEFENVWIVGGGSGHGFKHSPAVGEYVAGLVCGNTRAEPRFYLAGKKTFQSRMVY
jgi:sarcosine oxidase